MAAFCNFGVFFFSTLSRTSIITLLESVDSTLSTGNKKVRKFLLLGGKKRSLKQSRKLCCNMEKFEHIKFCSDDLR